MRKLFRRFNTNYIMKTLICMSEGVGFSILPISCQYQETSKIVEYFCDGEFPECLIIMREI